MTTARAETVDEAPDRRGNHPHDNERHAEAQEDRGHGPAGFGDNRLGQHAKAVEARAPRGDLSNAQGIDCHDHRIDA
jgi:hypothetical protein